MGDLAEEAVAARDEADARLQRVQDAGVVAAQLLVVEGEHEDGHAQGGQNEEVDHPVKSDQAQNVTVSQGPAPKGQFDLVAPRWELV